MNYLFKILTFGNISFYAKTFVLFVCKVINFIIFDPQRWFIYNKTSTVLIWIFYFSQILRTLPFVFSFLGWVVRTSLIWIQTGGLIFILFFHFRQQIRILFYKILFYDGLSKSVYLQLLIFYRLFCIYIIFYSWYLILQKFVWGLFYFFFDFWNFIISSLGSFRFDNYFLSFLKFNFFWNFFWFYFDCFLRLWSHQRNTFYQKSKFLFLFIFRIFRRL